jgi:phage terminase Nu1 subunit (DNA packaging protein)
MAEEEKKLAVKTVKELARLMYVTERTILRWKKKGMPLKKEGFYDLEAVGIWRKKMLGLMRTDASDGEPYWREMMAKNRARLLEIKFKKLQGKLIPREDVELRERMRILEARNVFFVLPRKIAPMLVMKSQEEIEIILYKAIREIINDFGRDRISRDGRRDEQ